MKKINKKVKINSGLPAQEGMTLIELIVVLSIFAVLSGVVIFNYTGFQSRVDIANLANNIALQVVNAQKSSLNGLLPPTGYVPNNSGYPTTAWKPSYGVYFSSTVYPAVDANGVNNHNFIYFVDLNNDNLLEGTKCQGECLNTYTITKNDYISRLDAFYTDGTNTTLGATLNNITITFERPNSGGIINISPASGKTISYIQITVVDSTGKNPAYVDLYPSGRVQIN